MLAAVRHGKALFMLLLLAATLVPEPAAGQAQFQARAFLEHRALLDRDDFQITRPQASLPPQAPSVTECSGGEVTFKQIGTGFTFRETSAEDGCAEVLAVVAVPGNVSEAEVEFRADRVIDSQVAFGNQYEQSLRIYENSTTFAAEHPYFEATAGTQSAPIDLAYPITAAAMRDGQVRVAWWFADVHTLQGDIVSPTDGAFTANVESPAVVFRTHDVVPLRVDRQVTGGGTEASIPHHVDVEVSSPGLATELHVQVPNSHAIHTVEAPNGTQVPPDRLRATENQGLLELVLGSDVVQDYGQGTYRVTFVSPGDAAASTWLIPVAVAVLAAPGITSLVSLRNARDFRRVAVGAFVETARTLRTALLVMLAIYALLVGYVLFFAGLPSMTYWPPGPTGAFVYAAVIVLSIGFIGVGVRWRAHLVNLMEEELDQQRTVEEQLRRSNEDLERFAYVASHDLQEPLRNVTSYVQLLQRRYGDQLDDDAREYIGFAAREAQHMKELVGDLLEYSRVEQAEVQYDEMDVSQVVARSLDVLDQRIQETDATVEVGHLPAARGDPRQVELVFHNLIGNAIKFSDGPPRIRIWGEVLDDRCHYHVADEGIGIEPRYQERIFQVFQRLHSRRIPGTGIGLAICQRIVDRHGGHLSVQSEPGKGSTFTFDLPSS